MGTVTLKIVERRIGDLWAAFIVTEKGEEHMVACLALGLRDERNIAAAWEKVLEAIIDDFAAFHGLTEVISSTRTERPARGDA